MTCLRPASFAFSIGPRPWALVCGVAMAWTQVAWTQAAAGDDFSSELQPFFSAHCLKCHGPEKQEGDLRLDTLAREFGNERTAAKWTEMMDRLNSGEMPPDEEPRPDADKTARVTEWIAGELTEAEAARQAAAGEKVSFRRLSREEYRNTIRDLLGVTFDVTDPAGLPEDPDWQGFERIGSVLSLSPTHVEKYLAAAETILNEALALGPQPKTETIRWTAGDLRVSDRAPARTGGTRTVGQGAGRHRAEQRRTRCPRSEDRHHRRLHPAGKAQRAAARRGAGGPVSRLCHRHRPHAVGAGRRRAGGPAGHARSPHASCRPARI